jgi:hypothetical protein
MARIAATHELEAPEAPEARLSSGASEHSKPADARQSGDGKLS